MKEKPDEEIKGILDKLGKWVYDPKKADGISENTPKTPSTDTRIFRRPPGVEKPVTFVIPRTAKATDTGKIDQEYFQEILNAIGQGAQPPEGFDQFIQLLIAMATTMPNLDLAQRFNLAFATVSPATGLTREAIIRALEDQKKAVESIFDEFLKGTKKNAESQKEEHANKLKSLAEQKVQLEKDIKDLERKLERVTSDLANEQNANNEVDVLLADNQNAFKKTVDAVLNGYSPQNWFGIDVLLGVARSQS